MRARNIVSQRYLLVAAVAVFALALVSPRLASPVAEESPAGAPLQANIFVHVVTH